MVIAGCLLSDHKNGDRILVSKKNSLTVKVFLPAERSWEHVHIYRLSR